MATTLQTLLFRGPRRVRLLFTDSLAAGAFTSTSYYAISNTDGQGFNPTNVEAVFAIANTPNAVELSLDEDLASGAAYLITCTAVPVVTGPAFTGTLAAAVPLPLEAPVNREPAQSDLDLLLYNRDLLHDGNDFVLTPDGDLGTVAGRDNYRGAMNRRMGSYGLTWDQQYGPNAQAYVNAPDAYRLSLSGALLAQARADDRTKQASVDVVQDPADPDSWLFEITIVGRDGLDPMTVQVPPSL